MIITGVLQDITKPVSQPVDDNFAKLRDMAVVAASE